MKKHYTPKLWWWKLFEFVFFQLTCKAQAIVQDGRPEGVCSEKKEGQRTFTSSHVSMASPIERNRHLSYSILRISELTYKKLGP